MRDTAVQCWQRRAVLSALGAAVIFLVAGCGSRDLLDPTAEPLATDREQLMGHMTNGLAAVADQLGAGEALATRVDTACHAGTDNWKIHDTYRSTCEVSITSGFALDTDPAETLGGVDQLADFEAALVAEGWGSADWYLEGNDPGVGLDLDWIRENGGPVTPVTGVRLWSAEGDGTYIGLGFVSAATPVEPANEGPPGGYYGDTEGGDWQDVWADQRDEHAFVVRGFGVAVLAEQPW